MIETLLNVDDDTVIDDNWFGYFFEDTEILLSLLGISGYTNYKKFLEKYEGYYITEFLRELDRIEVETTTINNHTFHLFYSHGLNFPWWISDADGYEVNRYKTYIECRQLINAAVLINPQNK